MDAQNGKVSDITNEVRALLSLLLKQHVRSWYTGLSQDEELFLQFDELIVHGENTLAGRVLAVDWSTIFSRHVPEIILRHLENFNLAKDRVRTNVTLEQAFKALQDHPATDDQSTYLMHVADALLVVLLPEEHLMSEVAYCFSRELVADLVLKTVIERLSEPWFWDEMILKLCHTIQERTSREATTWQDRIYSFACSSMSKIWSCVWSKHKTSSYPSCASQGDKPEEYRKAWKFSRSHEVFTATYKARQSLYETSLPAILTELLKPSDWPLLKSLMLSILLPLVDITCGDHILLVFRYHLQQSISHSSLAKLVALARNILFPNDLPSPTRILPSVAEQAQLHAQVTANLPAGLVIPFFESKEITKVLLFTILDLLLGTIFPELRRRSPEQLKEKVAKIRQANFEASGSGGIRTGRMPPRMTSPVVQKESSADRRRINLQRFESEQEGLEALEAMRRSFEVRRNSHLTALPRQH